jgi:uncharacterized repeat protein (TIGR03847 family)
MSTSFEIDPILRLSAGAVGEPGNRIFYIQARSADQLVTFLVEKEQVRALAVSIQQMLAVIPEPETVEEEADPHDLEEPLVPEWRVGPMALQYDDSRDRIVLVANELIDEEAGGDAASARLVATREQARALAEQAERVVEAGRPQCRFCGFPLDAEGHMCSAMNGHRDMD